MADLSSVTLTDLAKTKLDEYLTDEPSDTIVRILVEDDGKFGLSLDEQASDDATFELRDIKFAVESRFVDVCEELRIDYLEQGASSGFALRGGRAPGASAVKHRRSSSNEIRDRRSRRDRRSHRRGRGRGHSDLWGRLG